MIPEASFPFRSAERMVGALPMAGRSSGSASVPTQPPYSSTPSFRPKLWVRVPVALGT